MKALIIILLAIFLHSPHVSARIFAPLTQIQIFPTQATVYVINTTHSPIVCSGNIDGLTMSGYSVYSYLNGVVILPGQYVFIYIYTHLYNPFVGVTPRLYCHF